MSREGKRTRHREPPHVEEKKVASSRMKRSSSKSSISLSFAARLSTCFSSFFPCLFSPACKKDTRGTKRFSRPSSSPGSSCCSDSHENSQRQSLLSSSLSPLDILGWYTQITNESGDVLYALSGISPSASTEERQKKIEKEREEDRDYPLKKTTSRERARGDDADKKTSLESTCTSSLLNFPLPVKGLLHALIQSSLVHLHFYPSFFSLPVTPFYDEPERYDSFSSGVYTPCQEKKEGKEERFLKDKIRSNEEGEKSTSQSELDRPIIIHSGYLLMRPCQGKKLSPPCSSPTPSAYPDKEICLKKRKQKIEEKPSGKKKSKERERKMILSERRAIRAFLSRKISSQRSQRKKREDAREEEEEEEKKKCCALMDQRLFIFFLFVRKKTVGLNFFFSLALSLALSYNRRSRQEERKKGKEEREKRKEEIRQHEDFHTSTGPEHLMLSFFFFQESMDDTLERLISKKLFQKRKQRIEKRRRKLSASVKV